MLVAVISATPSLFFARAPFNARRVFIGSGPATGRSRVLAGLQPRTRPAAMAESFVVDDEVEIMGEKVLHALIENSRTLPIRQQVSLSRQ